MTPRWVGELERVGVTLVHDFPLGAQTTYRVGGKATAMVELASDKAITRLSKALAGLEEPPPLLVLGKGSNMCVADAGFSGLVVTLGESYSGVEIVGNTVTAGAALALPVLARRTASAGLSGLGWSVGVPGSVGGGLRMNAGGHGSQMKDVVRDAESFNLLEGDGATVRPLQELALRYRSSVIRPQEVVTRVSFDLLPGDKELLAREISEIVRWRRDHQPGGANAGSVFMNPEGVSAAALIEEAGLKGLRRGSAFVSPKHANFIQADKDASADDVYALVNYVAEVVAERTGVQLATEIRFVGNWGVSERGTRGWGG